MESGICMGEKSTQQSVAYRLRVPSCTLSGRRCLLCAHERGTGLGPVNLSQVLLAVLLLVLLVVSIVSVWAPFSCGACPSVTHTASTVSRLDWIKKLPCLLAFHRFMLNSGCLPSSSPETVMAVQEPTRGLEATSAAGRKAPLAAPKVRSVTALGPQCF